MKRSSLFLALSALLLALMALPACSATGPQNEPLVIGTTEEWTSFEVSWAYGFHDWELFAQCADGLLNNVPGKPGQVVPALAESFTASEDGATFILKLRPGLAFANGDPLTADAVLWSINRVFTIQDLVGGNANFLVTDYLLSIEKLDELTVQVTFKAPYPFASQLMATNPWKIVNPNQWTDSAPNTNNTACGVGPYVIESFNPGREIVFVANEGYYGPAPEEEKVIVRYFDDSPSMAQALKSGAIDIAWQRLAPAEVQALRRAEGITVQQTASGEVRYLVFNTKVPPFDNPQVRTGLAMLLDRRQLAELGWQGTKAPLYSMIPPGFLGHAPVYQGLEDRAAGKDMLAAVGYSAPSPMQLDLWYTPTHYGATEGQVAALIKEQWEASGLVQVNLQSAEWTQYRQKGRAGELAVSLLGWYPDYMDPNNYTYAFAHSPAAWWSAFYSNPEMDALLEAQATEREVAKRVELLEQIQRLWASESPFVPLAQGSHFAAYRQGISNVVLDAMGILPYFLVEKE